jgi:DNA adenine methylase
MLEVSNIAAKPFLKWAGGKARLIPQLEVHYPTSFNDYFEPFFGGGAVFFSLKVSLSSYINDINDTLMDAYVHIRDEIEIIIPKLAKLESTYKKLSLEQRQLFYYEQRSKFNSLKAGTQRTVLLIFLNKTCFNGLYRENNKGEFNVPFGKYTNPTICDAENLRAVSEKLKLTTITSVGYKEAVSKAKSGDFIYLDPPYEPLSTTSSFTAYHENGFTSKDQTDLRDLFIELDKRGCYVMLSNSTAPLIKELYKDYKQIEVQAARNINAKATGRGKITELVVLNY